MGSLEGDGLKIYCELELKAEAMKWILNCKYEHRLRSECEACKVLMHFFNITEADLQEKK